MDEFRIRLMEWVAKVVLAKEAGGMIDTYAMIEDVDKIIAEAFDRDPVLLSAYEN